MTTRFVIEGGLITREVTTAESGIPLSSLLEGLTAYQPLDLSPVPRNLKAIKVTPRENNQLNIRALIGHDSRMQTIRYKPVPARSSGVTTPYNIRLPFGLLWMEMDGNNVTSESGTGMVWSPRGWGYLWSRVPFENWQTPVVSARFPNVFGDSRICFGSVRQNPTMPIGHLIDSTVNDFWNTEFNTDIPIVLPFPNLEDWQKAGPDVDWNTWDLWSEEVPLSEMLTDYDLNFAWEAPVTINNAGNPIPNLNILPTFDNVQTWLSELSPTDRNRLIHVTQNMEIEDE
jgi:hypothetical protein